MPYYGSNSYYNLGRTFPRTFVRSSFSHKKHNRLAPTPPIINYLISNSTVTATCSILQRSVAACSGRTIVTATLTKTANAIATRNGRATLTATAKVGKKATVSLSSISTAVALGNVAYKANANLYCDASFLLGSKVNIISKSTVAATANVARHAIANLNGVCKVTPFFTTTAFTVKCRLIAAGAVTGAFSPVVMLCRSSLSATPTMNPPFICSGYVCTSNSPKTKRCYQMVFIKAEKTKYHQNPTGAYLPAITQCTQNEIIT